MKWSHKSQKAVLIAGIVSFGGAAPTFGSLSACVSYPGQHDPPAVWTACRQEAPCEGDCAQIQNPKGNECKFVLANTTCRWLADVDKFQQQQDGSCIDAGAGQGVARCKCDYTGNWYGTTRKVKVKACTTD